MAWTAPKTWSSEPLTSADMNTHIRDNLNHLKDRHDINALYDLDEGANYTTSSTSFVDVDATNLALTITTHGGAVLVGFAGAVANATTNDTRVYFDIEVDGVRHGGDDGILCHQAGQDDDQHPQNCSFVILIDGLSAASHEFILQWKVSASAYTMHAGAGTSNYDVHPQFWVKEI